MFGCRDPLYLVYFGSYAPLSGGFEGDTTDPEVGHRIGVAARVWLVRGEVRLTKPTYSGTEHHSTGITEKGQLRARLRNRMRLPNGLKFSIHLSGSNPVGPGSPDIDLTLDMKLWKSEGAIVAPSSLRGDEFPNTEVFIEDETGRAEVFLTFETQTGRFSPFRRIWGEGRSQMKGKCEGFVVR